MMNQLLHAVSKTDNKSSEKVTLTLQETTIHSLKELREHFNRDEILTAFTNDTLAVWLEQHYYETEAEQLRSVSSGDHNCFRKICRIFQVNYMDYMSLSEEEKKNQAQKEEIIKKVISDTNADEKLLEELPVTENPETADAARVAAAANGYDSFHESHSALATLFHNLLKTHRLYEHYHLPFNSSVMGTFYNSHSECNAAKKEALEKAYNKAHRHVSPGDSKCIAKAATEHYSSHIHDVFTPEILEKLQTLCEIRQKAPLYQKLQDQIKHCKKDISSLLEAELLENADFYAMYQFDYFMDQVEIEEHDYRISEGGFLRALETLAGGSIQYTITDIHSAISEMEEDINDHANTFFNTAQSEYQYYCQEIEELLQEIGNDFSEQKENESVSDYLQRLCSEESVPKFV